MNAALNRLETALQDIDDALAAAQAARNELNRRGDPRHQEEAQDLENLEDDIFNALEEARRAFADIAPAHQQTLDAIDAFMEIEADRVQNAEATIERSMGGMVLAEPTPEQAAAHAAAHAELLDAHTAKLLAEAVGQPPEKPNLSASEAEPESKNVRSSIKGDDSNTNANANDNEVGGAGDVRSSVRASLGPRPLVLPLLGLARKWSETSHPLLPAGSV